MTTTIAATTFDPDRLIERLPGLHPVVTHYWELAPELPDRLVPPEVPPGDRFVTIAEIVDSIKDLDSAEDDLRAAIHGHIATYEIPTRRSPATEATTTGNPPGAVEVEVHEQSLSYSLRYTLLPRQSDPSDIIGCGYYFDGTLRAIEAREGYPNFWALVSRKGRRFAGSSTWSQICRTQGFPSVGSGRRSRFNRNAVHRYMRDRVREIAPNLSDRDLLSPIWSE